jgi:hypothetical protein
LRIRGKILETAVQEATVAGIALACARIKASTKGRKL